MSGQARMLPQKLWLLQDQEGLQVRLLVSLSLLLACACPGSIHICSDHGNTYAVLKQCRRL